MPTPTNDISTSLSRNIYFGVYASLTNLALLTIYIVLLFSTGTLAQNIDTLDVLFECGSVVVALFMFFVVSFIKLNKYIKTALLLGLFFTQAGGATDCLDEVLAVDILHWSAVGDGLALIGELLIVYSLTRWIMQTYYLSMTDKLTGLYNRHYLEQAFEKLLFLKGRTTPKIALIMLDLDDFKWINDKYGHGIGDDVLRIIAGLLRKNTRQTDIVARLGGEEFEILLPNTDLDTAKAYAERVRLAFANHKQILVPKFTASLGIALYQKGDTIKTLRQRADSAVYTSKARGKNRVELGNGCDNDTPLVATETTHPQQKLMLEDTAPEASKSLYFKRNPE
ncbi:MAG: GGDEF domain-containing protein [Agarilytica sp.]